MKNLGNQKLLVLLWVVMSVTLLGASSIPAVGLVPAQIYLPLVFNSYIKEITNPGFEFGTDGWLIQSNQGDNVVTNAAVHSGQLSAGLGEGSKDRVSSISQKINVPQGAYGLQYYQYVNFPGDACPSDLQLMVYINNSAYKHYICKAGDKGTWIVQDIHLSQLKGTTVDMKLEFKSGPNEGIYLYVDDFLFTLY